MPLWKLLLPRHTGSKSFQTAVPKLELGNQEN